MKARTDLFYSSLLLNSLLLICLGDNEAEHHIVKEMERRCEEQLRKSSARREARREQNHVILTFELSGDMKENESLAHYEA